MASLFFFFELSLNQIKFFWLVPEYTLVTWSKNNYGSRLKDDDDDNDDDDDDKDAQNDENERDTSDL